MHIGETQFSQSPYGHDRTRIATTVTYKSGGPAEEVWFDVPATHAVTADRAANIWVTAFLPLAHRSGESIESVGAVDPIVLEGTSEILGAWNMWHGCKGQVTITAPPAKSEAPPSDRKTACFFSGGVDSLFSIMWHDHPTYLAEPVDELVTVWGLDIRVTNTAEIERARTSLAAAAASIGKPMIEVYTNIRATRLQEVDWYSTFGCVLAAIGHSMATRYKRVFLPSSYSYADFVPCGSHPVTDPLLSSSWTRITHDGAGYTRMDKIGFLGQFEVAKHHLRVCWANQAAHNCGKCTKCWRTMIALDIQGLLESFSVFPKEAYSREKLSRFTVEQEKETIFLRTMYKNLPQDASPQLRSALLSALRSNEKRFSRIRRFERLECLPRVGWLFGYYKRAFVARKRLTPGH